MPHTSHMDTTTTTTNQTTTAKEATMTSKTTTNTIIENIIIGDTVRSYDFAEGPYGRDLDGERACYVEGTVVEIITAGDDDRELQPGVTYYNIACHLRVWGGERKATDETVYAPINGTPTMLGRTLTGVTQIAPYDALVEAVNEFNAKIDDAQLVIAKSADDTYLMIEDGNGPRLLAAGRTRALEQARKSLAARTAIADATARIAAFDAK